MCLLFFLSLVLFVIPCKYLPIVLFCASIDCSIREPIDSGYHSRLYVTLSILTFGVSFVQLTQYYIRYALYACEKEEHPEESRTMRYKVSLTFGVSFVQVTLRIPCQLIAWIP